MLRRRLLFVGVVPLLLQPAVAASDWKAGAAKISITPRQSLWMGGFGDRKKPSEGQNQTTVTANADYWR
jgi:hypothetical protein